jgi:predicted amidohydrolase YtcJ
MVLVVACLGLLACGTQQEPADLVLIGGRIVTMDDDRPEARALAARGQQIVAVGEEGEIRRLVGPATEVIDLGGSLAVPGLIEAHAHFLSLGMSRMRLDLGSASAWDKIVTLVAEEVGRAEPGQWILGRGWHQEKWDRPPSDRADGLPMHDELSRVSPDNPVLLTHASGHAAIANALAMELAGIDESTADPPGGEIIRDARGRPIGVLRETAEELVSELADADRNPATLMRAVELAGAECLAKGITSFQDAGSSFADVEVLRELAEAHALPVRLWTMLSEDDATLSERLPGYGVFRAGGAFLTVGGIKRWVDGALGSHGAWLLEPYADLPDSTGLNIVTPEDLRETARIAAEHGLQLCTHAIGDRANRETLNVYQGALADRPDARDHRWRIEHAQHLHPDDIPRFGRLGIIAAMQPVHCTSDGPWVPLRLGEERAAEGAYVWRDLLESGAVIASGTDAPVEDVDPLANFVAAVTRRMPDGAAFHPEQRLTRFEALRSMTLDAAFAAFEEDIKGSLEVGKLADVTILSADILTIPEGEISSTRVTHTIVGGRVRYSAAD